MKSCSVCLLFLILTVVFSQKATGQASKNPCLSTWLTRASNQVLMLDRYQVLYDFKAKERIASVGAGGGSKEIVYSMMADSLVFFLQDIDSTCLTESKIKSTSSQLYRVSARTSTATFTGVIGTEEDVKLPGGLDKLIMENTLHELTYPEKTIRGIRRSLKPDGFLFIEDIIASKPGQKHRGCKKRLCTEDALISLLDKVGFELVESSYVYPSNKEDRLYKFQLR